MSIQSSKNKTIGLKIEAENGAAETPSIADHGLECVEIAAPTADNVQIAAGTFSLRTAIQKFANNIAFLFARVGAAETSVGTNAANASSSATINILSAGGVLDISTTGGSLSSPIAITIPVGYDCVRFNGGNTGYYKFTKAEVGLVTFLENSGACTKYVLKANNSITLTIPAWRSRQGYFTSTAAGDIWPMYWQDSP